jgi:hypothetical protein
MVAVPFSGRVGVPSHVVVRELDGEAVILNLDTEEYFGLDEVGTSMWNALTTAASIDAACEVLEQEFDVDGATLRGDLGNLVAQLSERGLVDVLEA